MAAHTTQLLASNSLALQFHPDKCPKTFVEVAELFKGYDVSRLHISYGPTTGLALVTFYDVRVAQQVLQDIKPFGWPAGGGFNDFRAVRFSSSQFEALTKHQRSFQRFGEIAGLYRCGGDIIIEFYDLRAALACSSSTGGQPERSGPMIQTDVNRCGSAKDDMIGSGASACRAPVAPFSLPVASRASGTGTACDANAVDGGRPFLLHADRRRCWPEFEVPGQKVCEHPNASKRGPRRCPAPNALCQ